MRMAAYAGVLLLIHVFSDLTSKRISVANYAAAGLARRAMCPFKQVTTLQQRWWVFLFLTRQVYGAVRKS